MEKEDVSICIAGAGLGGLAVARFLQMAGFKQVYIYEKDNSIESRPQGYSLSIQQGKSGKHKLLSTAFLPLYFSIS
jgi:2-polyprenyl-6-methoxyphenol hydroxylase-like FAD-dependent oxidoreductase